MVSSPAGFSLRTGCAWCQRDWQQDAARWRAGEMDLAAWCQELLTGQTIVPLIHHWLLIQGQRSMRGLRMNTLGWFDFKSAWFAPPEP